MKLQKRTKNELKNANDYISIKNARVNNLKNLCVDIPRNSLIAITGVSGSGKSSLAFDTLFAEGQRRYIESLNTYTRQFLGAMKKPDVDYIHGLSPSISIDQKNKTHNVRSTLGTVTELYDYLKILYARIGTTYSPISGQKVLQHTVQDVLSYAKTLPADTKFLITCPLPKQANFTEGLHMLQQKAYTRLWHQEQMVDIQTVIQALGENKNISAKKQSAYALVVDRLKWKPNDADQQHRIADSVEIAFQEGNGICTLQVIDGEAEIFSHHFEADGMQFMPPSIHLFSFNNPIGACPLCEGHGNILGVDEKLVIPEPYLSLAEGAIVPFKSNSAKEWFEPLQLHPTHYEVPWHTPYHKLTEAEKDILWNGKGDYKGIHAFFALLEKKRHKIQYRMLSAKYRGKTTCHSCKGSRLRKEASYVKINGQSITDLVTLSLYDLQQFFQQITLNEYEKKISHILLEEVKGRLDYLLKVGVGYLTLHRESRSLSGGEYQRIRLATSLGGSLRGTLYVLDEPSIGLHPEDVSRLAEALRSLQQHGNTVIMVEHEELIIEKADQIIDIGPLGGHKGGELVFQGSLSADKSTMDIKNSLTMQYLLKQKKIPYRKKVKTWQHQLYVEEGYANNLQHINVEIPLGGIMTVVTGMSGSGKSTLIGDILYPALMQHLSYEHKVQDSKQYKAVTGDLQLVQAVEWVDQGSMGRSSRSNPATYVKAYDDIRQLMAKQAVSQERGYTASFFSTNSSKGNCSGCEGQGVERIEMQFMADIELECESCQGKCFKKEVLDVKYKGKNIHEILCLTIDESIEFFTEKATIVKKLSPLQAVGLGYLQLGQSASKLSGGEAQRLKLAYYFSKSIEDQHTLFIFDEPTTGLHFEDIHKLLQAFYALLAKGNTIIIIEHNVEIIKNADYIIDLGPKGGKEGGNVCFKGSPEEMIKQKDTLPGYTSKYLYNKIMEDNEQQ